MKERWAKFQAWYDGRVLREQIIFLCIGLLSVYALVDFALLQRIDREKKSVQSQLSSTEKELEMLVTQEKVLIDGLQNNPGIAKQREVTQLRERVRQLEGEIQQISAGLVSSDDLPQVIREVLVTSGKVKLLGLWAKAPEELILEVGATEDTNTNNAVGVYKHAVVFRVEGKYYEIYKYLAALEASSWQFYWDELEYQVTDYPLAVAQITAYTLSTGMGFIDG